MNKKFVLLFVILATTLVLAITLTREATREVTIPIAARGVVCPWNNETQTCTGANEEIVFGQARVYPTTGDSPSEMFLIIMSDLRVYRSTGTAPFYDEAETETLGDRGRLSRVSPDGSETGETVGGYEITYQGVGIRTAEDEIPNYSEDSYQDLTFDINRVTYKLQNITRVALNYTWTPQ